MKERIYETYYTVSEAFPEIENITIKVTETNAWYWNRLKEFTLEGNSNCSFHLDCPMSKCIGNESGIDYKQPISDMVSKRECNSSVKLCCSGYGGYNKVFHCDWYVIMDISISYRVL